MVSLRKLLLAFAFALAVLPCAYGAAWIIAVRQNVKDASLVQRFRGVSNAVTAAFATMDFSGDTVTLSPWSNTSELVTLCKTTNVIMVIDTVRDNDTTAFATASQYSVPILSRTGSADLTASRTSALVRLEMTVADVAVAMAQRITTGGVGAVKVACFVNKSDPIAVQLYNSVAQQLPLYGSVCKYNYDTNDLITDSTTVSFDNECRAIIALCNTTCVTTIATYSADRQFGVVIPVITSTLLVQADPLAVAASQDQLLSFNLITTIPPPNNQLVSTTNSTFDLFQRYGNHGLASQADNWIGFVMGMGALTSIATVAPGRRSRATFLSSLVGAWSIPLDNVGTVLDNMGDTCHASPANVYMWQSDASSRGYFTLASVGSVVEPPTVLRVNRCDPMSAQVNAILVNLKYSDAIHGSFTQAVYTPMNSEINVGVGKQTPYFIRQHSTDTTTAGPSLMALVDSVTTTIALVGSPLTVATLKFIMQAPDQLAIIGNFPIDDGWTDDVIHADRVISFYPPPSWENRAMATWAASLVGQPISVYCSVQNSVRALQFASDVSAISGIPSRVTVVVITDHGTRPAIPSSGLFVSIFGSDTADTIRYVNEWVARATANTSFTTLLMTPFVDSSFVIAAIPSSLSGRYYKPYAPSLGETPAKVGLALGALLALKRSSSGSRQAFADAFSSAGAIRALPSDHVLRWVRGLDDGCSEAACATLARTTCPIGVDTLQVGNVTVTFPDCVLPSLGVSTGSSTLSNTAIGLLAAAGVIVVCLVVLVVWCACAPEPHAAEHHDEAKVDDEINEASLDADDEDADLHTVSKDNSKTSSKEHSGSRHSEELLIQRAEEGDHVEANSAFFEALVEPITVRRISMLGIPLAFWVIICMNLGGLGTLISGNILNGLLKDTYDDFLDAPSKASAARKVLRCANGVVALRLSTLTNSKDPVAATIASRYNYLPSECGASLAQLLSAVDSQTLVKTVDGITRIFPWQTSVVPPNDAVRGLATVHSAAMTIAGDAGGDAPDTVEAVLLSQAFFAVSRLWIASINNASLADAASLSIPAADAALRLAQLSAIDGTFTALLKEYNTAYQSNQVQWISTLCESGTWCSRTAIALVDKMNSKLSAVVDSTPDNYSLHILLMTYLIPGMFLLLSIWLLALQLRGDQQVNEEIALSQDDREVSAHLVPAAHLGQLGLSSIAVTGRFAEYDVKLAVVMHEFRYGETIPFLGSADEEYLFFSSHGAMITEVLGTGAVDKFTCGDCITSFFVSVDDAVNHVLNLNVRMQVTNVRRSSVDEQDEQGSNPTEMASVVHYGVVQNSVQEVQQQRVLLRSGETMRETRSMLRYSMAVQAAIAVSEIVKDSLTTCDAEHRPIGPLPPSYREDGAEEGSHLRMFEVYQVERLEVKQQRRSTRRMLDRAFRSGCSRETRIQLLREATQAAENAGLIDDVAAALLAQAQTALEDTLENTPRTPGTGRGESPNYRPSSLFAIYGDSGVFVQPPTPLNMSSHAPLYRTVTLAQPTGAGHADIPSQSFAEDDQREDAPHAPLNGSTTDPVPLVVSKPSPSQSNRSEGSRRDDDPNPPLGASETPTTPPRLLPDFDQIPAEGSPGPNTDKSEFEQSGTEGMMMRPESLTVPKDKKAKRDKTDKSDKKEKKEKRKKDKKERSVSSDNRSAVSSILSEEVERR